MFRKKFTSTAAILALVLFALLAISGTVKADSHVPDAIWIEPSSLNLTAVTPVGAKFNVTAYTNMSVSTYTWQVTIKFNVGQIQVVRADYTGAGKSQYFTGHTTVPVAPQIDNVTGSVQLGESLIGVDTKAAGTGSLMWAEFQIMAGPTSNDSLTSTLNINSSDTYMLDADVNEILTVQKFGADYSYFTSGDTTPPTINAPTLTPPANNVSKNEAVTVSVDVTDDSGVNNVTLFYSTDNATWTPDSMTLNSTTNLWEGTIPGYLNGTTVYYYMTAFDNAGNMGTYPTAPQTSLSYIVLPELTFVMLIVLLTIMTAMIVMTRKRFVRSL